MYKYVFKEPNIIKMKIISLYDLMRQIAIFCILAIWGYGESYARQSYYPFRTTVTVSPTGAGKVYASYDGNAKTTTENSANYDETIRDWDMEGCTTTVTLSATANTGYRFLRWEEDNSGRVVSRVATTTDSQDYDTNEASYNTRYLAWLPFLGNILPYNVYSTRRDFKYTAFFALQGNVIARVKTGQESIGSADILEETLTPGNEITLVASNINGSEFQGWAFDHWELNGVNVSTEKTIKVTVPTTQNTLTYIAHFRKADTEYYCFIRNKSTGRYLKLSDKKDYTKPTNTNNPVGSFNGSFTLVSEKAKAITDPGCVFTISGTSDNNMVKKVTLISQGVAVGFLPGSQIINDNTNGLTISPASDGAYYISANYHVSQSGYDADIPIYFRDNSGTPDISGARSTASEWEILELSRASLSQNFFGLAPNSALVKDGKYYTTLYTTFPYELQSGRAYYVNHESIVPYGDENEGKFRVVCQEITNKKVPANQAVIIECDGLSPENNKILPLSQSAEVDIIQENFLRGHITFRDKIKTGDGNIYVISVGQASGLGFYKLKTGVQMPDNKAYSTLNEEQQNFAKNVSFFIGDDEVFGITTAINQVALPEDVAGQAIYDLQGRRVLNPSNGIYIVNGKKFVVK